MSKQTRASPPIYSLLPTDIEGFDSLAELALGRQNPNDALVCAEAVPWRCHRSLIADALLVRGIRTEDIMSPTRPQIPTLTPFAKVRGTTITYPAEDSQSTQTESRVKHAGSQTVKRSWPLTD